MPTRHTIALLLIPLCLLCIHTNAHAVIYVDADATGANNGSSWQDAFVYLQDALDIVAALPTAEGREIWVAQGVYRPDLGQNVIELDRNAVFNLSWDVVLLGGFQGGETSAEQRNSNPLINGTALSGDLLGNDDNNIRYDNPLRLDNSKSLVLLKNQVNFTFSGFALEGVNDYIEGVESSSGAALLVWNVARPIFSELYFRNNSGYDDACIRLRRDSGVPQFGFGPILKNLTFTNNKARSYPILNVDSLDFRFENISVVDNTSDDNYLMYLKMFSHVSMNNVTLDNNVGGIFLQAITGRIDGLVMRNNVSANGFALIENRVGMSTYWDSRFYGNRSENEGLMAAVFNTTRFVNCEFIGNESVRGIGGAIYGFGTGTLYLVNSIIAGNAALEGGGVFVENFDTYLQNTIVGSNVASNMGGGLFNDSGSLHILNSVVWNNSEPQIALGVDEEGECTEGEGGSEGDYSPSEGEGFLKYAYEENDGGTQYYAQAVPSRASFAKEAQSWRMPKVKGFNFGRCFPLIVETGNSIIESSGGSGVSWDPNFGTDLGENLDTYPGFITPLPQGLWDFTPYNYRVISESPVTDAGDNLYIGDDFGDLDNDGDIGEKTSFDLDYAPRIQGATVDIGPYEGIGVDSPAHHKADLNFDFIFTLSELLRVVQLFNLNTLFCLTTSEDGYAPGNGDTTCTPHSSDYAPQDWSIGLSELLRLIQLYNAQSYSYCPTAATEDGFCLGF